MYTVNSRYNGFLEGRIKDFFLSELNIDHNYKKKLNCIHTISTPNKSAPA